MFIATGGSLHSLKEAENCKVRPWQAHFFDFQGYFSALF